MPRFTKKPVTIEAMRYGPHAAPSLELMQFIASASGEDEAIMIGDEGIEIETLEGTLLAKPGDWIIKGVKGELYPCKNDIFEATYERAAGGEEPAIKVKSKAGPRITPDMLDAEIAEVDYHVFPGKTLTVCALTLRNGFTVIGQDACASLENFDPEVGRIYAYENAREAIWPLLGFRLKDTLHAGRQIEEQLEEDARSQPKRPAGTDAAYDEDLYLRSQEEVDKPQAKQEYSIIAKVGDLSSSIALTECSDFVSSAIAASNIDLRAIAEPQDFGFAIRALKQGYRVAREGWNGKGMWLALSCDGTREVPAESFWSPHNANHAEACGGKATVLPSITMKTADGSILMGWLASQTDMLADDWHIVGGADE